MKVLDSRFGLNFGEISEKHKDRYIKSFWNIKLLNFNRIEKNETNIGDRNKLTFNGILSLKEIKKLK
jgi:hypothetical protein